MTSNETGESEKVEFESRPGAGTRVTCHFPNPQDGLPFSRLDWAGVSAEAPASAVSGATGTDKLARESDEPRSTPS